MADVADVEPDERLWQLVRAPLAGWALAAVVELGIAEELESGTRTVDALAARTGASPDILRRLLRALATEGVFAETSPRMIANTAASDLLRRDASPWRDAVLVYADVYRAAAELPNAVRTGDPLFERARGVGWWEILEHDAERVAAFNRLMQSGAESRVRLLQELEGHDELIDDIGGGSGAQQIELVRAHSDPRGIVFDLPAVVREASARITAAGFDDRRHVVAGPFLSPCSSHGDVYVLAKVLHDWDDDHATRILRNVRAAAPEHARLLIIDA